MDSGVVKDGHKTPLDEYNSDLGTVDEDQEEDDGVPPEGELHEEEWVDLEFHAKIHKMKIERVINWIELGNYDGRIRWMMVSGKVPFDYHGDAWGINHCILGFCREHYDEG